MSEHVAAAAIKEQLAELNPDAVLWDGFDEALVGIASQFNTYLALYDYERMLAGLEVQGLDTFEAAEHLDYNVLGGYLGANTPLVLHRTLTNVVLGW